MKIKRQPLSDKVEKIIMTSKSEHKFYTKDFKDKKNKFKNKDQYQNFVRRFFEKIADHLINNPNGVLIEELGYFFCFMIPERSFFKSDYCLNMNLDTDGYKYCLIFSPVKPIAEWSMDKSFSKYVKKNVRENLINGSFRYKSHFYYLKRKKIIY